MNSVLKKRLLALLLQGISAAAMVVLLLLPMQCFDVYQAKRAIPVQAQVYRIEQVRTEALSYWQVTLQLDPKNHILITDVIPGDWYAPGATAALITKLKQQRQVNLYRIRGEQYFLAQGNYAITIQPAVLAIVWLVGVALLQRRQLHATRLQQVQMVEKAKNRQQRSAEAMTNQFLNMPISARDMALAAVADEHEPHPSQTRCAKVQGVAHRQMTSPHTSFAEAAVPAVSPQTATTFLPTVTTVAEHAICPVDAKPAITSESVTTQPHTTSRKTTATPELC